MLKRDNFVKYIVIIIKKLNKKGNKTSTALFIF